MCDWYAWKYSAVDIFLSGRQLPNSSASLGKQPFLINNVLILRTLVVRKETCPIVDDTLTRIFVNDTGIAAPEVAMNKHGPYFPSVAL
jgi:hypothetical protein